MRKLIVFENVSLDGYFTDAKNDLSWAHKSDPEWNAFTASNARQGGMLLFGRVTYEMMAAWWPTPAAAQAMPEVAKAMNALPKLVFSTTLKDVTWQNSRLVKTGMIEVVKGFKQEVGPDMVILGSGKVVAQLAAESLIDDYQLVVNPIVLGKGRTLFEGVSNRLGLELTSERRFRNGNVLVNYRPQRAEAGDAAKTSH